MNVVRSEQAIAIHSYVSRADKERGIMATYVLVHGAFGGAHTFRHVRPRLISAGHDVFTPALSGIGERSHLANPQTTLRTHSEDVENVFMYWDLRDVVLLGYSYGGMVVTNALRSIGDRVEHLVYLDAFVPNDGDSLNSLVGASRREGLGSPWLIEPIDRGTTYLDDATEESFQGPRRTPQPAKTFSDPVVLERPLEQFPFTRTYIKATGEPRPEVANPFWQAADRAHGSSRWRYHEIDTNHAIPENRPDELVAILRHLL